MAAKTNCPRCSQPFACTPYSGDCWCFSLSLNSSAIERIREQYDGCLCGNCLGQVAALPEPKAIPTDPDVLAHPIGTQASEPDYYVENGFMVLTRSYLLNRGYCCGNGCRHCPYKTTVNT